VETVPRKSDMGVDVGNAEVSGTGQTGIRPIDSLDLERGD
jgi:hypothetical protein